MFLSLPDFQPAAVLKLPVDSSKGHLFWTLELSRVRSLEQSFISLVSASILSLVVPSVRFFLSLCVAVGQHFVCRRSHQVLLETVVPKGVLQQLRQEHLDGKAKTFTQAGGSYTQLKLQKVLEGAGTSSGRFLRILGGS